MIFLQGCESNQGQLGPEPSSLTIVVSCPPPSPIGIILCLYPTRHSEASSPMSLAVLVTQLSEGSQHRQQSSSWDAALIPVLSNACAKICLFLSEAPISLPTSDSQQRGPPKCCLQIKIDSNWSWDTRNLANESSLE